MKTMIAISTGPETHLDHLAPLCELLDIPLLVTEREHLELAQLFYPMIDCRYISLEKLTLEYIANHFDVIFTCGKFWATELKPQIQMIYGKDIEIVHCPHGYSDKESMLGKTVKQDLCLAYAPKMSATLETEKIAYTGNVRLWFYQKHQKHFATIVEEGIASKLDKKKKTVLYAPTWETKATPTSFFSDTGALIETLSHSYNLLIKLHPLLEENHPAHFYAILGKYEKQAHFIVKFPPIYPLLEKSDIYLGDFSSIGYDFLYFNRPMYFLKKGGILEKCGKYFSTRESINEDQKDLREMRQKTYFETFGESCDPQKVRKNIFRLIQSGGRTKTSVSS